MVMSRFARRFSVVGAFLVCCLATCALAQHPVTTDPTINPGSLVESISTYRTDPGTGILVFTVFADRTGIRIDRQALLKLVKVTDHSALVAITEDNARGFFTNVPLGSYEVEVSAVGYLSSHKELQVLDSQRPAEIEIVLRRDPEAINLDVAGAIMSPKARKQAKHAISALKSGNLPAAQKQLDQAYKLAPSSPEVNFLLGYLYFEKKDFAQAGNFLGTAASSNPHNAQALTLLGRANLERNDYPAARSALEQAVLADFDNWLPHDLLADTYLRQKNYDKARDEAQIAITKGKALASPAQLVLGESLLSLGQNQAGIQALNTFLAESPKNSLANQVRKLIAEISERNAAPEAAGNSATSEAPVASVDPLAAVSAPTLSVRSWQPPSIDDVKPALASGASCPTATVIEESGKRVEELVQDLARFAAIEDLFHQPLDAFGLPIRTETRKYNYVASISAPTPGSVTITEYRADKLTLAGYPDQIASTGFVTLALVFHPDMRNDFDMECEGLGDWQGQATWLVHFRQRPDRPNRMHSYKLGEQIFPVDLKGRAWITADKFQIVRIEADMVKPMPEIRLLSEHQAVEYGPVPFPKKKTVLWLPKTAEIYFDFRKHYYYRRHSFDHYLLFSVDAEEKRKEPKG